MKIWAYLIQHESSFGIRLLQNRDKVKANAVACCDRLGKHKMPFAWTAIYLANVVSGMNSLEREMSGEKDTSSLVNSLGNFVLHERER